jgi:hypothetical protein
MDGTGKCIRADNGLSINCLIIPGGVIACRDSEKRKYSCVQYGLIVSSQSEFFCQYDKNNLIRDSLLDLDSSPDSKKVDEKSIKSSQREDVDFFDPKNSNNQGQAAPSPWENKMPLSHNEAF